MKLFCWLGWHSWALLPTFRGFRDRDGFPQYPATYKCRRCQAVKRVNEK